MMRPKLNPEKKSPEVMEDRKSSSGQAPKHSEESLPLPVIARMLGILELRDDHAVEKNFLLNEQTAKELSALPVKEESKFLGILARCKIPGCDVHALDSSLNIIDHFHEHEKITDEFVKARTAAATLPDSIIAIIVYSDHLSYLYANGKLEVCHEK